MDNLEIELDFTGTKKAAFTQAANWAPAGFYEVVINEFKLFTDNGQNKLYVYASPVGTKQLVSTNFNIGNEYAMEQLAALLVSAGIKSDNLIGKRAKVPFHKLVGKHAYCRFTPPEMVNGVKVEGSFPKCGWMTKEDYSAARDTAVANVQTEKEAPKVEAKSEAKADTTAPVTSDSVAAPGGDDDWLNG